MTLRREWHLITGEFPPQVGGVSDHSRQIAVELANAGDVVHVWAPAVAGELTCPPGVSLRRELGTISPRDLRRLSAHLDEFRGPRRLLVQWVPHSYGYRSMNVWFCLWLLGRARRGDEIDLIVHEPFLAFGEGTWRQDAAAAVHRVMMLAVLWSARRVWVSTSSWIPRIQPYVMRTSTAVQWLPIASNVPVSEDLSAVRVVRERYAGTGKKLVGHFGTFGLLVGRDLEKAVVELVSQTNDVNVILLGNGGPKLLEQWTERHQQVSGRVFATGYLEASAMSAHLLACDLMLQPYPDGITTRRTSVLAALAHGVPVVTTTGHLTEAIWKDGEAVALVKAADVRAMVSRVATLLGRVTERLALGQSASRLYKSRFEVGHAVRALRSSWTEAPDL